MDSTSEDTLYIDNKENILTAHGPGTNAAQQLVDSGIEVLITGKVGSKAGEVLKSGNIEVFGGVGYVSVKEAYEFYKKGRLIEEHQYIFNKKRRQYA